MNPERPLSPDEPSSRRWRDKFHRHREEEQSPDPIIEAIGLRHVREMEAQVEAAETEAGLQYVGKERGTNRKQRRDAVRAIKRVTRHPRGCKTLTHPLLKSRTPWGVNELRRRRAKAVRARASRKAQYRLAAVARRQRQKINKRRKAGR